MKPINALCLLLVCGGMYTRDEMIQAETDRYAFIRRSANPTGIYMSYEEFKTGKPAFEHFYLKREAESTQKKEIKLPDQE